MEDAGEPSSHQSVQGRDGCHDDGQVAFDSRVYEDEVVLGICHAGDEQIRIVQLVERGHAENAEDGDTEVRKRLLSANVAQVT